MATVRHQFGKRFGLSIASIRLCSFYTFKQSIIYILVSFNQFFLKILQNFKLKNNQTPFACFFLDRMKIENTNASAVQGTIRIFLIPILDEKNEFYDYENARKRAFELDRFMVLCKYPWWKSPTKIWRFFFSKMNWTLIFCFGSVPPGLVRVIRKDIDSSMTIRQDRTYPNEKDDAPFVSLWNIHSLFSNRLIEYFTTNSSPLINLLRYKPSVCVVGHKIYYYQKETKMAIHFIYTLWSRIIAAIG